MGRPRKVPFDVRGQLSIKSFTLGGTRTFVTPHQQQQHQDHADTASPPDQDQQQHMDVDADAGICFSGQPRWEEEGSAELPFPAAVTVAAGGCHLRGSTGCATISWMAMTGAA
jgi:hypothetical protein